MKKKKKLDKWTKFQAYEANSECSKWSVEIFLFDWRTPFSSPLDLELQVDTFSRLGLNLDLKVYTTYGFSKTCLLEKKL